MDPVSVIGLTAAIGQLLGAAAKVIKYLNKVRDAPKERAKLAREVSRLIPLFTDLKCDIEEAANDDPGAAGLRSLEAQGAFSDFKTTLEELTTKLAPRSGTSEVAAFARWPFDGKKLDAILQTIERFKSLLLLVRQRDQLKLSEATRADVKTGFASLNNNSDYRAIVQWLRSPDPKLNYESARSKRHSGTGEWFLHSTEFERWKQTPNSFLWLHGSPGCGKTVLFSTALTELLSARDKAVVMCAYFYFDFTDLERQRTDLMLRSLVLQLLSRSFAVPDELATAYKTSMSGNSQPDQPTLLAVLRSLVAEAKPTYLLLEALDECNQRGALLSCLREIHGWDLEAIHILVTSRKEQQLEEGIKPLVSRELPIRPRAVDKDIRLYIRAQLAEDSKLKKWPSDVQEQIDVALAKKHQGGGFRWAALQLEELKKCIRPQQLQGALASLPKDLNQTYDRVLASIDPIHQTDVHAVLQCLCFSEQVMKLRELVEVLATDLEDHPRFDPHRRILDPLDILRLCSSLVTAYDRDALLWLADSKVVADDTPNHSDMHSCNDADCAHKTDIADKSGTSNDTRILQGTAIACNGSIGDIDADDLPLVTLAHLSVQEYLLSSTNGSDVARAFCTSSSAGHALWAKVCIAYLIHFLPQAPLTSLSKSTAPLMDYASSYWLVHYDRIENETHRKQVDCLLLDALIRTPDVLERLEEAIEGWWGSRVVAVGVREFAPSRYNEEHRASTAFQLVCIGGCKSAVRMMLGRGLDVNRITPYSCNNDYLSTYALPEAVRTGDVALVRLLLEHGFDVSIKSLGSTALHNALHFGAEPKTDMVRLLLEYHADLDPHSIENHSPLLTAYMMRFINLTQPFVACSADLNSRDGEEVLLHRAARTSDLALYHFLINNDADVNARDAFNVTPLIAASSRHFGESIVRALLAASADVHRKDHYGRNALHVATIAAASHHSFSIYRLLLEAGADTNTDSNLRELPLHTACESDSCTDLVGLFLVHGALLTTRDELGQTPMHFAAAANATSNCTHLIAAGADLDAADTSGRTPLQAASERGAVDTVSLLLDKGASPRIGFSDFTSALLLERDMGCVEIENQLTAHGLTPRQLGRLQGHWHSREAASKLDKLMSELSENEAGKYGSALLAEGTDRSDEGQLDGAAPTPTEVPTSDDVASDWRWKVQVTFDLRSTEKRTAPLPINE